MDTPNVASVAIPKDMIEPIIQAHVARAVLEAMGDKVALMHTAVARVLNAEVDYEGRPASYHRTENLTWLQHQMQECIRKATREAIEEAFSGRKDAIKAQILEQLRSKKSPLANQLVEAMTAALTNEQSLKYSLEVSFKK